MNFTLILVELILWAIVCLSGLIAREFYKAKSDPLRDILISFFICKVWLYGGTAVVFLIFTSDLKALLRLVAFNAPMFLVMLKLYWYIKRHNS